MYIRNYIVEIGFMSKDEKVIVLQTKEMLLYYNNI